MLSGWKSTLSTDAAYECVASSSVADRAMKGFISNLLNGGMVLGTAYCTQKTGCRLLFKAFPPAIPYSAREGKSERRQQIQRQGMAFPPPYPLFGLLPARKLASNPKSPHPSPLPREREQVAAASKVRRISHITHKKQPAPRSCTESEKAACTLKNQVQAAF